MNFSHGKSTSRAATSLEAYVVLDPEPRAITVYRRDEGPQTHTASAERTAVALSVTISLPFDVFR